MTVVDKTPMCTLKTCSGVIQSCSRGSSSRCIRWQQTPALNSFRLVLTTERTEYIVTNDLTQQSTQAAADQSSIRWHVEQFHREDKQTTGIACCQCRKQRSQRNHIAIAMLVWTRLKTAAYQMKKTGCQLKFGQLDDYLHQQLDHPTLSFA